MSPDEVVAQLRGEVEEITKITISAGIAANAKLAKICSNKNKPNGQYRIPSERTAIMEFMRDLPCRKVNGVGRVFERELEEVGIKTCGDIYKERAFLSKLFGEKAFHFLINCYLGLGRTNVQPAEEYERKSVGTESTFRDKSTKVEFRDQLRWTADELEKDMKRTQFKGRTLVLKIKMHTYEVISRQVTTPSIWLSDDLYKYSLPLLEKLEREFPDMKLRLMGLRMTHLVSTKKEKVNFFGLSNAKRKASVLEDDGTEWEVWPEEEFEAAERQEKQEELELMEKLSQEQQDDDDDPRRLHGKLIVPNPKRNEPEDEEEGEEETWDCPICMRPQPANDREFNDHVDLCLSRGTIKEAVRDTDPDRDKVKEKFPKSLPVSEPPKSIRHFFNSK
jgi:DNA polymerase kappa